MYGPVAGSLPTALTQACCFDGGGPIRATFQYGPPQREDCAYVIWRRIGRHAILRNPLAYLAGFVGSLSDARKSSPVA